MPHIRQETLIHTTVQCIQANINAFVSGNGIVISRSPEDVTCPDCQSFIQATKETDDGDLPSPY